MKKSYYPYLSDFDFLIELIHEKNIIYYVRINVLDKDQNLLKEITGKVTSGNINIDGKSAIRRTGSLSFITEENDQDAYAFLELNKKIYLQIGYKNNTYKYTQFPIIWFPQGVNIITSLSFSHSLSGITISLSFKDKMCLLNGQFGGTLPAATIFDSYYVQTQDGQMQKVYPTIYQIITQLVNHFGGEQLGNIIISDLDTRIRQVMRWTADVPLFVLRDNGSGAYYMTTNQQQANSRINSGNYRSEPGSPFEAGSNVGFTLIDFTYPGDLIGNPGDSVVTILDKIKNTLGNFEYFYDVNGCFRFQEIKNYLNNSQSKYILESLENMQLLPEYLATTGETYLVQRTNGKTVFSFKENNDLVISYSNNPQIQNIKNDFIIWGIRKDILGKEYPIRYHLAIDKKPQVGNTYDVVKYVDLYDNETEKWYKPVKYNKFNDFPSKGAEGVLYYAENTYEGHSSGIYIWKKQNNLSQYVKIPARLQQITTTDWRTQLYFQGISAEPNGIDSNFYYAELLAEWPKIYDITNGRFKQNIIKNPSEMDYFLDFINPVSEEMRKISVENIGRRSFVLNKNNNINCVFQPYTPEVIMIRKDYTEQGPSTDMKELRQYCNNRGWDYCQINDSIYNYLSVGINLNSGYEEIRQTLYQYINYMESISLQTLPIYFLQPNTCIEIQDKDSFIKGNYIINSMSFSFDTSGILNINASKLLERYQ